MEIRAKMQALQAQLSKAQAGAGHTSPPYGDGGMCRWQIKSVGGQWCDLLDEQNAALSNGRAEGLKVVNLQVMRCPHTRTRPVCEDHASMVCTLHMRAASFVFVPVLLAMSSANARKCLPAGEVLMLQLLSSPPQGVGMVHLDKNVLVSAQTGQKFSLRQA